MVGPYGPRGSPGVLRRDAVARQRVPARAHLLLALLLHTNPVVK